MSLDRQATGRLSRPAQRERHTDLLRPPQPCPEQKREEKKSFQEARGGRLRAQSQGPELWPPRASVHTGLPGPCLTPRRLQPLSLPPVTQAEPEEDSLNLASRSMGLRRERVPRGTSSGKSLGGSRPPASPSWSPTRRAGLLGPQSHPVSPLRPQGPPHTVQAPPGRKCPLSPRFTERLQRQLATTAGH